MKPFSKTRPRRALFFAVLLASLGFVGCAQRYEITLSNGDVLVSSTRPKPDGHGYYIYRDVGGQEGRVNSMRVRQIEAK